MIEETKRQLLEAKSQDDFLTLICQASEKEAFSDENHLVQALIELHNSSQIDLVKLLHSSDGGGIEHNYFKLGKTFAQALPTLAADTETVIKCISHLSSLAGSDCGLYEAFKDFCRVKPERPDQSIQFILNKKNAKYPHYFLSNAILAAHETEVNWAISMIELLTEHSLQTFRQQGYFAAACLVSNESQSERLWKILKHSSETEIDESSKAALFRAILRHGIQIHSHWDRIYELLESFLINPSSDLLHEISTQIAFERAELPEKLLELLIDQLRTVTPKEKAIIDNIDYLLVKLFKKELNLLATSLLESLICQKIEITAFDYLSNYLIDKNFYLFSQLATKWFLSADKYLCKAISDLSAKSGGKNIELNADLSILDNDMKKVFVCQKAIGWLFASAATTGNFILSLYGTCSPDAQTELEQLLFEPLLLSYPGEFGTFLKQKAEEGAHVEICSRLLAKLEEYHADLDKIHHIKELRSPSENVRIYWKNVNLSMQKARDDGPKSIFENLFTVQNLLYGNSSIYYVHDGSDKKHRAEMKMSKISFSTEMPRLSVIDPEGLNYLLKVFRVSRLKNETNS